MPIALRRRAAVSLFKVLVVVMLASGCGGTTTPTPPSTPIIPPPPPPNNAPTVSLVTVSSPRVEADQQVEVTAFVADDLTPIDQLTYEWSAEPVNGTFTGSGPRVQWRAPRLQPTPAIYTLKLAVVEKYTESAVPREHRTAVDVQVRYNDSHAEVSKLSTDFLNDFATYSVSADQCVRNFSDNCRGKAAELSDIRANRINLQIQSGRLGTPAIRLNPEATFANADVPCTFVSIQKATGRTETATGTCLLTAVYEDFKWYLCDSNFRGVSSTNRIRGLHP
jgi:hypothetical protein